MQPDGRARSRLEFLRPANVVDVCVRHHDAGDSELVALEHREDVIGLVARVDDQRLAGLLVAQNRAVACQQPHRQDLMNHILSVSLQGVTGHGRRDYRTRSEAPSGPGALFSRRRGWGQAAYASCRISLMREVMIGREYPG